MIKVVDNFLNQKDFLLLRDYLFDNNTPWFVRDTTIDGGDNITWFGHCFYIDNRPDNDMFDKLIPPVLDKLNVQSLMRVQCNLCLKSPEQKQSGWHYDTPSKNSTTSILYMNTNNGYTSFKDNTKVDCVENRMVIFPSSIEHCGVLSSDSEKRIVINFNYYV